MSRKPYVAVVGAGEESGYDSVAQDVGRELARRGAVIVCGGLTGVMAAACKGAREEGGTTVGILPGTTRADANPYVDVAIPTGMGEMRNALVVRAADAVIAVDGEFGTLSEIAFALKTGVPVVAIDAWELIKAGEASDAIVRVTSAQQAVDKALSLIAASPPAPSGY